MAAIQVQDTLAEIERNMRELAPYRASALFNEFLVQGYTAITLDSVPPTLFSDLLRAKLCLGTLITLYDDFADRPTQHDPQLLEILYQLKFGGALHKLAPSRYRRLLEFAQALFAEMEEVLCRLPHYDRFKEILNFDLLQFYSANRLSSLVTVQPFLGNALENRLYAHHNMGMVMASMMDFMAVEKLHMSELGTVREIFLLGQRMGRIFNVLATHQRESLDGDITGELAPQLAGKDLRQAKQKLAQEIFRLRSKIANLDSRITSFSVSSYLSGLDQVQKLHQKMEGVI